MKTLRKRGSDERKAMFANLMNSRYSPISMFADKPDKKSAGTVSENTIITPAVIEDVNVVGNIPEKDIVPTPEATYDHVIDTFRGSPVSEETSIEKAVSGPSVVENIKPLSETIIPEAVISGQPRISGDIPLIGPVSDQSNASLDVKRSLPWESYLNDRRSDQRQNKQDIPKQEQGYQYQTFDEFGNPTVIIDAELKKSWKERMKENLQNEMKGVSAETGPVIKSVGRGFKRLNLPEQAGKYLRYGVAVAAPAAAVFGYGTGVGVTEAIRETGDLITAPKREFYMPQGYQRVWTGMGDNYQMVKVDTPQMQPVHYDLNMGVSMPPGVVARQEDIAAAVSGGMQVPLWRGIKNAEANAEVKMGSLEAGRAFETRRRNVEGRSPNEIVAKMNIFDAGRAFMEGKKTGRAYGAIKMGLMEYPKSEKQKRAEAIMSLSMSDAAKAFETGARMEVVGSKIKPKVPYMVPRSNVTRVPVSMEIPISSSIKPAAKPKVMALPGAGGAVNRYIRDRDDLERARSEGDVGAADRAEARMQSRVSGLERSPTPQAAAILAGMGG